MVTQPFDCNVSVLPEGMYAVARSTISPHGAINSTTCNRFAVGLFNEWGTVRGCCIQSKSALLFSSNCSDRFPVGLSLFFGVGGVGNWDGKEVVFPGRVMVAHKCFVT